MGRRERMSSVDTAWLRMDSAGNLMVIVGVYEFSGTLDQHRLRELLLTRFAVHFRMRARAVIDATGYFWEEDDDFDLDRHLIHTRLPDPGGVRELEQLTGDLASAPLNPMRPLWEFQLVDNYKGGQALVVRIHHCIADGIALIGVLLALTSPDSDHEVAPQRSASKATSAKASAGPWNPLLRPLVDATTRAIDVSGDIAGKVLQTSAAAISEPHLIPGTAADAVRIAAQVTRDAAAIALMSDDTQTSLKGTPSGKKALAWNDALPLDEVKAVCRALGCSVNDVLLACVAGALRAYLQQRGEAVDGAELRAMVPVNLRDPSSWRELGNKFGLVPMLLPVGIANPIARVFEVRQRMDELKKGYTAVLAMTVLGAAGMVPRFVQKQALDYLACKATMVMTNVPGPQQPLFMAGAEIRRLLFWVPQSGDIAVGISVLSYNGHVQFGLIADRSVCSEPQQIIANFAPEFEKLALALCMLPWDGDVDPEHVEDLLFTSMPGPPSSKSKRSSSGASNDVAKRRTSSRTRRAARSAGAAATTINSPNDSSDSPI